MHFIDRCLSEMNLMFLKPLYIRNIFDLLAYIIPFFPLFKHFSPSVQKTCFHISGHLQGEPYNVVPGRAAYPDATGTQASRH